LDVVNGVVDFKVRKATGSIATRGQVARAQAINRYRLPLEKRSPQGGDGPLSPEIRGGTETQRRAVEQAHRDGFLACQKALHWLADDSAYREWFGASTPRRLATVQSVYTKIIQRMQSIPFLYRLDGRFCRRGALGYTFKKLSTIWLCESFWSAPARGADSKAGTIVHEHSHGAGQTLDLTYGQAEARALAARSPHRAIRNADSYEYFAEV
jgi:peptidyl-Lys metalloendopeptidase